MNASLTIKGYTFTSSKYDEEMEIYLASIPFVQRQGVKGMLDFLRLYSREDVAKFVKANFSMKPTKNIVINAIIKYTESDKYKDDVKAFNKYIDSKNFFPSGEIEKMSRFQEYISTDLKLDAAFFRSIGVVCEEQLEFRISLILFNTTSTRELTNHIDTSINAIYNERRAALIAKLKDKGIKRSIKEPSDEIIFSYKYNGITNNGVLLDSSVLEEKINNLNDITFTQKQFIKAVLIYAQKASSMEYNDFLNTYSGNGIGGILIYEACCKYIESKKYHEDEYTFRQLYHNGMNIHYEDVLAAFNKAGIKTKNGITVQEIITRCERRIPCIPCLFEEIIKVYHKDNNIIFTQVNFIQSIFNVLQDDYIKTTKSSEEIKEELVPFLFRGNKVDNNGIHLSDSALDKRLEDFIDINYADKQFVKAVLIFSDNDASECVETFVDNHRNRRQDGLVKACINYLSSDAYRRDCYIFDEKFMCGLNNEIEEVVAAFKSNGIRDFEDAIKDVLKKRRFHNRAGVFYEIIKAYNKNRKAIEEQNLLKGLYKNMKAEFMKESVKK